MDSNSTEIYDVIILGAGISGLGSAYNLLRNKNSSFLILEKSEGVGGTWRENTYPGLCCDVPSHFYSFSFDFFELYLLRFFLILKLLHPYQFLAQ